MKSIFSISQQLVVLTLIGISVSAKPWHGITPLQSTRADVEKIWGEPKPPPPDSGRAYTLNDNRSIYFTDEGEIYVLYARFTSGCDKRVTPDTVLMVSLTLKHQIRLSELGIGKGKYRTYDPAIPKDSGYKAYSDEAEGVSILTFGGNVEEIIYQPTSQERKLCPQYFENGKNVRFSLLLH